MVSNPNHGEVFFWCLFSSSSFVFPALCALSYAMTHWHVQFCVLQLLTMEAKREESRNNLISAICVANKGIRVMMYGKKRGKRTDWVWIERLNKITATIRPLILFLKFQLISDSSKLIRTQNLRPVVTKQRRREPFLVSIQFWFKIKSCYQIIETSLVQTWPQYWTQKPPKLDLKWVQKGQKASRAGPNWD